MGVRAMGGWCVRRAIWGTRAACVRVMNLFFVHIKRHTFRPSYLSALSTGANIAIAVFVTVGAVRLSRNDAAYETDFPCGLHHRSRKMILTLILTLGARVWSGRGNLSTDEIREEVRKPISSLVLSALSVFWIW